jgi:two-component system, NarL family, response regulator LiaR
MTISVLLVDDHTLFRQGVRAYLGTDPHFNIIGEAGSGSEALEILEQLSQNSKLPDIIVLDWVMSGAGGLETIRQLNKLYPQVNVIILSLYAEKSYVSNALQNGAKAYVLKDDTAEHLIKAIYSVISGQRYLSPILLKKDIDFGL